MDKFVELVELPDGNVVAVGGFTTADEAHDFAQHIEYSEAMPALGSRGGVRLLTVAALARELGIRPALLKPVSDAS
jgi:hypothetical protein